jgi:hypothetical protein
MSKQVLTSRLNQCIAEAAAVMAEAVQKTHPEPTTDVSSHTIM